MIPKVFDLSNWKDEDGIILTKKGKSTEKNVLYVFNFGLI